MTSNLTERGQEIIPKHPLSKTECKLIRSREGCQFGINWNSFKEQQSTTGDISQKQREVLAKYNQEPFTVIAIYACFSKARTEFGYDTILLKDVTDENKFPLCDHLWVKAPRYIPQGIEPGDSVKVFGRINLYTRADGSSDYTLFVFNLKKGVFD